MKRLLLYGGTAVLLFGLALTGSILWQRYRTPANQGQEGTPPPTEENTQSENAGSGSRKPGSAAEETAQLAVALRERLGQLADREAEIAAQQKNLELIKQDIHSEQAGLEKLRREASEELRKAQEVLARAARAGAGTSEGDKLEELRRGILERRASVLENRKKLADMVRAMPAAGAAKILHDLTTIGQIDTAAELLSEFSDKQAAAVLTELAEPGLAAVLVEKMKKLHRPQEPEKPVEPLLPPPRPIPPRPMPETEANLRG
jgi:flagellar motility protein MotE (MotC chaperone)